MRPPVRARRLVPLALLALASCGGGGGHAAPVVEGGEPAAGRRALDGYGCGTCHAIPGVRGAHAMVGPPLRRWAERGFIAGALPNTPANLVRWVMDPQAVEPGTVMPDMGVTREDALDIAAYLFTLR